MNMEKLVSIISPCFNGEKYLSAFFDSVIKQTYNNIELIFVDDGSTDATAFICEKYEALFQEKGIRFKYIYQENSGQAAAINNALSQFQGEFLSWFDSDDIMLPQCVEKKVSFLNNNPNLGFVLCRGAVVDETNTNRVLSAQKRIKKEPDNLFRDLIDGCNVVFTPGTIMATRSAILNAIPTLKIYEGRQGQNLQMMLPLAYTSRWGYLDEILYKYVVHQDSHCHTKRNYVTQISRNNEFVHLIHSTIDSIQSMPAEGKKYWKGYCSISYTRKNLQVAFKERKRADIKKYRSILLELGELRISDFYPFYKIWAIFDTIRYLLFIKSK